MNPQFNVVLATDAESFLPVMSLVRALPDSFVARSEAVGTAHLDGGADAEDLIKKAFVGYKAILPCESVERGIVQHGFSGINNVVKAMISSDGSTIAICKVSSINFQVRILSSDESASKPLAAIMDTLTPHVRKKAQEGGVFVQFSREEEGGADCTWQFLRCPEWAQICGNYEPETARALEELICMKRPWEDGSLMIWQGPPGTGKTFAIRALMSAWQDRFNFIVVTDPENLVGNPAYYSELASNAPPPPGPVLRVDGERKRTLFIMEDCADLILEESRSTHFDKVGKLLNMTDGLFGQGREDLFLLSFNEAITKIDEAFLRPGRCTAEITFGDFDAVQAAKWLRDHGKDASDRTDRRTIAELYAELRGGRDRKRKKAPAMVGFKK